MKQPAKIALLLLRIIVGWHFIYEGIIKLYQPEWSAVGYLEGSVGFFSGFYHWMASNPGLVQVIDFLNVWGLILLGSGLFLGLLTRISAISGIVVLTLYYFAYPPFGAAYSTYGTTGHFWIINSNFIEAIALFIVYLYPMKEFSLMKLITLWQRRNRVEAEQLNNAEQPVTSQLSVENSNHNSKRREMLKGLAALPFFGGMVIGSVAKARESGLDAISGSTIKLEDYNISDLKGELPKGRLGDLEFGRVIIGHNMIGGTTHTRDLLYTKQLFLRYNTEERVMHTWSLAEQAGINMANITIQSIPKLNKYKKRTGSKMMSMAQVHYDTKSNDKLSYYKKFMELGANTMYVMGVEADNLVEQGNLDPIHEAIEFVQSQGYPAGVAAHSIQTVIACEKAGVNPDYYFKTMHHDNYWSATPREFREEFCMSKGKSPDHNFHHDNMWDVFPEQTVDVLSKVEVPIVGFKTLAAGAIHPEDGFRYAFENGADFICVGLFDYQVIEDVNVATAILESGVNRTRPWYA